MAGSKLPPQPEERRSTEWAYGLLRRRILDGDLPAGAAVSQASLADELGVSRTPLREATRLLQNEGLLEGEPNRRLRVAGISAADLDGLYAQRIAIECLALRASVETGRPGHSGELASALHRLEAAALGNDTAAGDSAHREFHLGLVVPAGDRFARTAETLWDHSARYRRAYLSSADSTVGAMFAAQDEHWAIVDAVAAGDGHTAASLLARHYAKTAEVLIAASGTDHRPTLLRAAAATFS